MEEKTSLASTPTLWHTMTNDQQRRGYDMREWMIKFDTFAGTGTAYYYANTKADALKQIREELAAWNGGHANVYDENGEFVCDVEV